MPIHTNANRSAENTPQPAVTDDIRKQLLSDAGLLLSMPFSERCAFWRASFTLMNASRKSLGLVMLSDLRGSFRTGTTRNRHNAVSITRQSATNLIGAGLNSKQMALRLGISQPTLRKVLRQLGLFQRTSDEHVHDAIQHHLCLFPSSGCNLVSAFLRIKHPEWRVRRGQVRQALQKIRTPILPRGLAGVPRHDDGVQQANASWHLDACCKLAFAGMWVHMIVDRHSKLIAACVLSHHNSASAALKTFCYATEQFMMPRRLCVDSGVENSLVGVMQSAGLQVVKGLNATENQPVERRWQDLKSVDTMRGHVLRLFSGASCSPIAVWAQRSSAWLVFAPQLQQLLNTETLRWNVHSCSNLPNRQSPLRAKARD